MRAAPALRRQGRGQISGIKKPALGRFFDSRMVPDSPFHKAKGRQRAAYNICSTLGCSVGELSRTIFHDESNDAFYIAGAILKDQLRDYSAAMAQH